MIDVFIYVIHIMALIIEKQDGNVYKIRKGELVVLYIGKGVYCVLCYLSITKRNTTAGDKYETYMGRSDTHGSRLSRMIEKHLRKHPGHIQHLQTGTQCQRMQRARWE